MSDLQKFRIAAQGREWTTLQDTFKRLIADLDPLLALQIAAPRVRRFLPTFESYYPEAGWVRELLLTVVVYGSAPNDLPEHALIQFRNPGCGNFLKAIFDLARAVQPKYTLFEKYSHITNAVANVTLAELQHLYFSKYPQWHAHLIDPQTDPQTQLEIQSVFWLDETVARLDMALWSQIADLVEKQLQENRR